MLQRRKKFAVDSPKATEQRQQPQSYRWPVVIPLLEVATERYEPNHIGKPSPIRETKGRQGHKEKTCLGRRKAKNNRKGKRDHARREDRMAQTEVLLIKMGKNGTHSRDRKMEEEKPQG